MPQPKKSATPAPKQKGARTRPAVSDKANLARKSDRLRRKLNDADGEMETDGFLKLKNPISVPDPITHSAALIESNSPATPRSLIRISTLPKKRPTTPTSTGSKPNSTSPASPITTPKKPNSPPKEGPTALASPSPSLGSSNSNPRMSSSSLRRSSSNLRRSSSRRSSPSPSSPSPSSPSPSSPSPPSPSPPSPSPSSPSPRRTAHSSAVVLRNSPIGSEVVTSSIMGDLRALDKELIEIMKLSKTISNCNPKETEYNRELLVVMKAFNTIGEEQATIKKLQKEVGEYQKKIDARSASVEIQTKKAASALHEMLNRAPYC